LVELAAFFVAEMFSGKITSDANLPPSSSTALMVSASMSAWRCHGLEFVGDVEHFVHHKLHVAQGGV
jgi:hypothetical protein